MSIISVYDVFLDEEGSIKKESETSYALELDQISSDTKATDTDSTTSMRLSEYREHSSNNVVLDALDEYNASSLQGEVAMEILTTLIDPIVEKSIEDFREVVNTYITESLETKVAIVREKSNPAKLPALSQELDLTSDESSNLTITKLKSQLDSRISTAINKAIEVATKDLALTSSNTSSEVRVKVAENSVSETDGVRLDSVKSNPIVEEVVNEKWTKYLSNRLSDLGDKYRNADLFSGVSDTVNRKLDRLGNTLSNGLNDIGSIVDNTRDSITSLTGTIMDEITELGMDSLVALPGQLADIANGWIDYGTSLAESLISKASDVLPMNDLKSSLNGFLNGITAPGSKFKLTYEDAKPDPYQMSRTLVSSMMLNKNLASTFDWCIKVTPPANILIPDAMMRGGQLFYPILGYELSEGALMSHSANKIGVDIKLPSGYLRPNRLSLTLPDMYYIVDGVPYSRSLLRTLKDRFLHFIRCGNKVGNTNRDFRSSVFEITVIKLNPARKNDSKIFQKTYLCIPDISIMDSGNSTRTPVIETINFTIVGEKR